MMPGRPGRCMHALGASSGCGASRCFFRVRCTFQVAFRGRRRRGGGKRTGDGQCDIGEEGGEEDENRGEEKRGRRGKH